MKFQSVSLLFCTLLFPAAHVIGQTTPHFHFTEQQGGENVGLKVVDQYDYARTWRSAIDELGKPYAGERARPLQTLVWYPAEKNNGKPMTVGDYIALRATETDFSAPPPAAPDPSYAGFSATLADAMWAVRDAPMKAGHFPVVIYAPSFSNVSWENADLCEYMASHGYVVIAGPNMGASTRGMTGDIQGIDAQAGDISFLIGYAHSLPDTDTSEIAVGGFSWGGISNLFAASRDNRIRALFALDGSMRYFPNLVKQATVHPENLGIPLLYFTQGEITLEESENDIGPNPDHASNVLNVYTHGDLLTVHMMGLTHGEFSSMFQRDEHFWKGFTAKDDYSRSDGATGYGWVARYTVHFLDAYLKHDADAMAWLHKTPVENGAPPHNMAATFRSASGSPVTLDSFRQELNRQGWDHAPDIYAAMQKQDPGFKLDEGTLNDWGYSLLRGKHLNEAVGIFQLNVKLNPDSGNAYDSLAEAYMSSGQKQLSIDNYRKSLEKNPENQNAKDKLKELENASPGGR